MKTTLNLIRKQSLRASSWDTLVKSLPTDFDPDQEFSLADIVESNGPHDAVWCLRATTTNSARFAQRLVITYAEHVLPIFETTYPDDKRPRLAIQAAKDYLAGNISLDELNAARTATADADAARPVDVASAAAHAAAYPAFVAARTATDTTFAVVDVYVFYTFYSTADLAKIFLDMLKRTA